MRAQEWNIRDGGFTGLQRSKHQNSFEAIGFKKDTVCMYAFSYRVFFS
jgi:hypothetical protein